MKKIEFFELAIRVFALFLFYSAINQIAILLNYFLSVFMPLPSVDASFPGKFMFYSLIIQLFSFLVLIALGILCIFKSRALASALSRGNQDETLTLNVNKAQLFQVAIIIAGLFVFINGLPDLIAKVINQVKFSQYSDPRSNDYNMAYIVASFVELVLGLLAIFYSGSIADYFDRKRAEV